MGRAKLIEGQECRYGHPWQRSADWKRCLACYPPAPLRPQKPLLPPKAPRTLLSPEERRARKNEKLRAARARHKQALVALGLHRHGARPALRARLYARQKGRCALTGLPLDNAKVHVDHIVPVSCGGTDEESNLQLVLKPANMAKGNGTCSEFQSWLLAAADALRQKIALQSLL